MFGHAFTTSQEAQTFTLGLSRLPRRTICVLAPQQPQTFGSVEATI